MLENNLVATAVTFALALAWLRLNDFAAHRCLCFAGCFSTRRLLLAGWLRWCLLPLQGSLCWWAPE